FESFDLDKGSETLHRPLPNMSASSRGTAYRDKLFYFGGSNMRESFYSSKVTAFNITEERWFESRPMRRPRSFHRVAAVGDSIYIVGGSYMDRIPTHDVEIYYPQEPATTRSNDFAL